jgi:hypothetical protein
MAAVVGKGVVVEVTRGVPVDATAGVASGGSSVVVWPPRPGWPAA